MGKAIELREDVALYYDDLGLVQMKIGNEKEAIKNFGKAVKLDPSMGVAFLHRAQAKIKLNQIKSSCADLEAAATNAIKEAKELLDVHCIKEEKEEKPKKEENDQQ